MVSISKISNFNTKISSVLLAFVKFSNDQNNEMPIDTHQSNLNPFFTQLNKCTSDLNPWI